MLLLGLLPSNTFDLTKASEAPEPSSYREYITTHHNSQRHQLNSERYDTHLPNLLLRLPKRQRLRLRKEVAQQDAVVLRARDRVVGRCRCEEVGGDELCALVDELVEGVLAVGAGGAPDDWLYAWV
jgi:hypothetical protein